MPVIFEVSYHVPVLLILHQVCTYDVVIGSQTMHHQLSSTRLYIARQYSAAQCGAVPCPSFCGAVSCGAVHSFEHTAAVSISSCSTRYDTPGLCTCFVYSSFCFVQLIVLSRSPCTPPRKYRTYCRSERDINKLTAQRRAISSA